MSTQPGSSHQVHLLTPDEIIPYEQNPRNNEAAVDAVISSIMQFGFRVPILVDKDNVIIAGHTRHLAVRRILERDPSLADKYGRVPCLRADDLSDEQVRALRIIDNKTSELAEWDFDLLANEVGMLKDVGIDLTQFGWTQEEIDCLRSVVAEDCLDPTNWQRTEEAAPDGVNAAMGSGYSLQQTSDGASMRMVIGTFGWMVLRDDYQAWFDKIMKEHSFDYEKANDHVASLLGLKDAKDARQQYLYNLNAKPTAEAQKGPAEAAKGEAQTVSVEG